MPPVPTFHTASRHSLQQLAVFFSAAFEDFYYPAAINAEQLAKRIREESLDIQASTVMALSGYPIGIFLLARRKDEAWCGGFGVNKPQRRQGYAKLLASEMVTRARNLGVKRLYLEVLTKNVGAIRCYEQAGFHTLRELLLLSWKPLAEARYPQSTVELVRFDPTIVLDEFPRWHADRPCWQRTHSSMLAKTDLTAYRLAGEGPPQAYVLCSRRPDGTLRLFDIGSTSSEQLLLLLEGLKSYSPQGLILYNEGSDSPHLPALYAAGFFETDRQYEMSVEPPPCL